MTDSDQHATPDRVSPPQISPHKLPTLYGEGNLSGRAQTLPQTSEIELVEETEKVDETLTAAHNAIARINVRAFKMLELFRSLASDRRETARANNNTDEITTVRCTIHMMKSSPKAFTVMQNHLTQ